MKTLTIFCSGKTGIKEKYIQSVNKLISGLDTEKIQIAYGGGNIGLMGVVRDAYLYKGGKIITSNIHKFTIDGMQDDYLFDNITERQSKLIELGDIFLALPGGYGTIYELLEVITKNQIEEISKEVIIYNYKGIYDYLLKQMDKLREDGFIKHDLDWYKIKIFTDEEELCNYINNL